MFIINKAGKKLLAGILTIVLVFSTFPLEFASVFAAIKDTFTVSIEDYSFSADVTLTDTDDSTITQTETASKGKASFSDFVDNGKTYNLQITGLIGYENYSYSGLIIDGNSIEIAKTNLTEIEKATASGIVIDENDAPVSGVTVSYSAYDGELTGSTNTNASGEYSFDFYKGVDYSVTITGAEKYVVKEDSFKSTSDKNLGTHKLQVKQFGITVTAGANGSVSESSIMVNYGENAPSIEISANQNYIISSLTIDGTEVSAAVGADSYDVAADLKNITADHTVHAEFVLDEIEVTFTVTRTGKIDIKDGTSISTAGTVTVSNDSDITPLTDTKKLLAGQTIQAAVSDNKYHIESFMVGSEELLTTYDNDTHESPEYTFDKTKTTISVKFALDTFTVTTKAGENGSITQSSTVNYGSEFALIITPNDGYDIETFSTSNDSAIDVDSLIETINGYELIVENITEDITISATFKEIDSFIPSELLANDYYNVIFYKGEDEVSPVIIGTDYIVGKNGKIEIIPVSPTYSRVRINRKDFGESKIYSSNKNISSIEVTNRSAGGWKKAAMDNNINFIVDNIAPTITKVEKKPNVTYYNGSYSVTGTVTDNKAGIDKVYYSTTNTFADTLPTANYNSSTNKFSFDTTANEFGGTYYIWAVDKVGNVSSSSNIAISVDINKPTIENFEFKNYKTSDKTGIYSNNDIKVTVTAADNNGTVKSGVKAIQLLVNGNAYGTPIDVKSNKAEFTLSKNDFATAKTISAYAVDIAGNQGDTKKPTDVTTTYKSNNVTISNTQADITVTNQTAGKIPVDGKDWYAGDALFSIAIDSKDNGVAIKSIELQVNGTPITVDSNGNDFNANLTATHSFSIKTNQDGTNNTDGENTISGKVILKNGNEKAFNGVLYIDTTAPDITGFEFKNMSDTITSKFLHILTFGLYSNDKVEIKVSTKDDNATSGLKEVTLYRDEHPLDTMPIENGVATFVVPADEVTDGEKHFDVTISAKATDNVGNVTENFVKPSETNSNIKDSRLMIETVKPSIVNTACPAPATDKNTETGKTFEDWYKEDIEMTFKALDTDSGLRSVVIKVNDVALVEDMELYKGENEGTKAIFEKSYTINTKDVARGTNGEYVITAEITDNAGNVSTDYIKTIYKDDSDPSVVEFKFEATGYDEDTSVESTNTDKINTVVEKPYGFYFLEDTKVTVTAEDVVPTAGIKSISYYTVDINGVTSKFITDRVDADNKIYFTIPANFKGQIYAKATDNVDNVTTDYVNPNGVVIENEEQHKKTSYITYKLKDSKDAAGNDVLDANGNKLYGADTTVDVEIADTYSGIRQIDWEIVTPFDDKKQAGTVTVNNDGTVTSVAKDGYSDDCLGEWKQTNEDNLVTILKNTITVTNNSNDIEIHFTLTDRAGNTTKDVVQKLSVDKTAPMIAIQMNENDDQTYTGFFKGEREATVYVYERNFDSNDFIFDVKRVDDNNNETNVSPTSKFEKVGVQVIDGVECYVYKMNTTFTDDGDYSFAVSAQDTAANINNNAAANHKVKDAVVKYSNYKSDEYVIQNDIDRSIDTAFTIDNTNPVVSVSYDNNDVRNEKYFNNHRTATITVTEHNFTTTDNRITYTRTSTKDGSAIAEPKVSNWSKNGNTYTATINYNADGDYTFAIDIMDKAGNELKDKDVIYIGNAVKDFAVDTTIDKPIITGIENGNSYKDSVLPQIDFSDINFKDYKIVLTRTRKDEINKDVTDDFIKLSTNNKGGSFSANENTFKKVQENDGIYTLSVDITDKAENTSSEQVVFTINRFGSVYTLGNFLITNLNNKYVQSVNEDIVISEYNPDKLKKGSLDVVVTRDGSPVDYKDGELKISPVVNEFAKIGDSGWYQYQYTISKNVFLDSNGDPADGIYKIYIGSEDTVGNKSENISYDECEVMFRLDHTPPTIKSVSGLEKKIVNADKLNVSYEIFDAIGIDEIVVEYYSEDGNRVTDRIASNGDNNENLTDVLSDLTSYSGEFTIGSSNGPEDVRIYIKDLAGNVTDTNDEKFDIDSIDFNRQITISTNFFVRWYANKPLFWGSLVAIAVAGGVIAFFIATKKRKKDDERTEEIKKNARGSQG